MRNLIIIFTLILFSCTDDNRSVSDSTPFIEQIEYSWTPPIDTLNVIEENFWEARVDSIEIPSYLYPSFGSNFIFGYEYLWLELKGDTLVFTHCQQGSKYEFGAVISLVTEDSLILTFSDDNEFGLKAGSQLIFDNDRKYFHEDFRLEKISYSTADPMQHRHSFSVEFDSIKFIYKSRYFNGGSDVVSCHQGATPAKLFNDVQEILSKIQLYQVFKGPKEIDFLDPFKLLVIHNDTTEKIEGYKYALHPRLANLLDRLESGGPRNHDFLEMLRFSLAGDDLEKLNDYSFKVGEIQITNDFPNRIEDIEEVPVGFEE
ncbi:MAG: hypothetical protein GQ574_15505 [Crocinitomix sp.]|nr:hypothetical protein [Crocinitomix sp.]